ncbi:MAG TPA: hypothetical protein VLC93_08515, partial [Myxococcota bacterium]|nr:hypothetical protein [Myxococcota bacterium]
MRKHSPIVVVTLVLAVACSDKKSGSDVLSARIVEPNGIATILRGTAFDLRATFADGPNAVTPDSVSWRSSETDDQLPQTNPAHNVVLTPGVRAISVTGKLAGKEGSDQVEITVGDIGVAIARPTNRRQVAPGQTVALQGEGQAYSGVNQIQLNPVNAVFAWTADGVAFGGNQNQLQSPMTLTVGEHTIELTITYSDPATTTVFSGSARITLVVNTAPAVSITAPNCPIDLPAGSPQTFVGIASDAEDGPLTGSWVDLLTGEDTSGDTWVFASDVIGKHELEYSAADSTDHIARDTCGVRVYPVGESAAALFPSAAAVSSAMPNDNIEVVYLDGSGNLLAGSHGQLAVFDTALALINDGSGSSNPYDGTELGVGGGSTVRDVIIVGTKLLAATADGLAQCDYSAGNLSACTDIGDGQDFNGVAFASDTPLGGVLASSAVD